MKTPVRHGARERGASLVIALIALLILAMLGIAAITVSNTQSRLSVNLQLQTQAGTEAESALARAEDWLAKPANVAVLDKFGATNGLFAQGATQLDPLTMSWNDSTSIKVDDAGNQRYAIETYAKTTLPGNSSGECGYGIPGACPDVFVFRVTARGSARGSAERFVQTLYTVRSGG